MNRENKIFKKISERGVSLVELVVAVGIFSLVTVTASGIFINAIKAQKIIAAKQNVAENLRYTMEFMVKELRMAQKRSPLSLTFVYMSNPASGIIFKNGFGSDVIYEFIGGDCKISGNCIIKRNNIELSSGEINITGLSFAFNNWDLDNSVIALRSAPLITIIIKAEAKSGVGGEMEIQDSVSPRIY